MSRAPLAAGATLPAPPPAPPRVDVVQELAVARDALAAGDRASARVHLETAADANPYLFVARLDLASLLLDDGVDLDEAERRLDEARALRPDDARLGRLRGALLEARGDAAGAADAYGHSLALVPDADLALRRGLLLKTLGRDAEAIAELERVRADRPSDRVARAALASLYEGQRRYPEAESELLALARYAPESAAPLRGLAAFYLRRGDAVGARRAEAEARLLEPAPRALRPLRPSGR